MKTSPIVIAALLSMAASLRIQDDDTQNLSQSLLDSNADIGVEGFSDRSDNMYDKEMKSSFAQVETKDIIDKNNDGVEDNQLKTQDELDRFRKKVFGGIEEMHNTHNGEFPGHVRSGEYPMPALTSSQAQLEPPKKAAVPDSASNSAAQALNNGVLAQSNAEINVQKLADKAEPMDMSMNDIDSEYIQMTSSSENRFAFFINNIQSTEDLEYVQTSMM